MTRNSIEELPVIHQVAYSIANVAPYIRRGAKNFVLKLRPAVQYANDIFQVVTHYVVFVPATVKGGQFCCKEVRRVN